MSGGSRVSIPKHLRQTIQDIKEIARNHSDDDIYAMLTECNMDPNDTAQRLLYLDTFHEVKRKRDRRKVNVSNRASEEFRLTLGKQWQGARGNQGNYPSPNVSDDVGGERNVGSRKENGVNNRTEGGSRTSTPVLHKTENNATPRAMKSSTVSVNDLMSVSSEGFSGGSAPHLSAGVYSSTADTVLVPSLNSRNPGAVGTMKHEISSQRAPLPAERRSSTRQEVTNSSSYVVAGNLDSNNTRPRKSQVVEKSQLSESSKLSSLLPTHKGSPAVISNRDSQPPQKLNGPSKVVKREPATVAVANIQPVPEKDNVFEEATPKLDMKLEKLNLSPHQPVIFPDHLQVPEVFKNRLTFGSLDAALGSKDYRYVAESVLGNRETCREPFRSDLSVTSAVQDGDFQDRPEPPPNVPENELPLEDNIVFDSALKLEQSTQEILPSLGGPQYPLLQTIPEYSFVTVPPVPGPHLVQREGPELQCGDSVVPSTSGPTPPATQPAGIVQSSMALPMPFFPFFRLPYPPNYIPYSPYFPHLYLAQNSHQFLGHSGFPQQVSTGDVYIPPPAAASGVKFPVPLPYKPETNVGNLMHYEIPSGYASYGSYPFGYSSSGAATPGSSSGSEDLAASQPKERNIYSAVQQSEDLHVRTPVPGREISSLPANYFFNLPQGLHASPAQVAHGPFTGLHHPSQTTAAPSTVPPLLHQSQAMAGSMESVLPHPVLISNLNMHRSIGTVGY